MSIWASAGRAGSWPARRRRDRGVPRASRPPPRVRRVLRLGELVTPNRQAAARGESSQEVGSRFGARPSWSVEAHVTDLVDQALERHRRRGARGVRAHRRSHACDSRSVLPVAAGTASDAAGAAARSTTWPHRCTATTRAAMASCDSAASCVASSAWTRSDVRPTPVLRLRPRRDRHSTRNDDPRVARRTRC